MVGSDEKSSICLNVGLILVAVNIICAIISFFVILTKGSLFWALITLVIYAISTFVSAFPFFALHELYNRVQRLELSEYGYSYSEAAIRKRDEQAKMDMKKKDYNLNLLAGDDNLFSDKYTYDKSVKKLLSDGRWVCSCGRVRQSYTVKCDCGEEKPKVNNSWNCICGKTNLYYVGTCACGRRKPS